MKNMIFTFFATVCLNSVSCHSSISKDKQPTNIEMRTTKDLPIVELSGNGYERGRQHGKVLKEKIAEVFLKWKKSIETDTKENADTVISAFLQYSNFEPSIKKFTPEIYDEIKGIAESSGQPFKDVLAFQLVDEFWVYIDKKNNIQKHHCSSIGVAASAANPAYVCQNMDLDPYMNGYQVLLHIRATTEEPEQYILSCAGLIGLNGVNSRGIGLCVNTLMELNASHVGLPVACIVRGVLLQNDGTNAIKFIKMIPHASCQNYVLGVHDKVYDFEASCNKVVRYLPDTSDETFVYHTNHPLTNDDVKSWYLDAQKKILAGEAENDNSVIRFNSLKNRIQRRAVDIDDNVLKEIFR
jgi:isopenicillin-N N-acyltransferase like protein